MKNPTKNHHYCNVHSNLELQTPPPPPPPSLLCSGMLQFRAVQVESLRPRDDAIRSEMIDVVFQGVHFAGVDVVKGDGVIADVVHALKHTDNREW